MQRRDQVLRNTAQAEAAHQDRRAVGNQRHRVVGALRTLFIGGNSDYKKPRRGFGRAPPYSGRLPIPHERGAPSRAAVGAENTSSGVPRRRVGPQTLKQGDQRRVRCHFVGVRRGDVLPDVRRTRREARRVAEGRGRPATARRLRRFSHDCISALAVSCGRWLSKRHQPIVLACGHDARSAPSDG